jgi:uncharacterized RDD family membrane protein YckC
MQVGYTVLILIIVLRACLRAIIYVLKPTFSMMKFANIYMQIFLLAETHGTLGKKTNFVLDSSHLAMPLILRCKIGM